MMAAGDFNSTGVLAGSAVIAAGVVIALLTRISTKVNELSVAQAEIKTILTGADGNNGLNGEVKSLRSRSHEYGDSLHKIIASIGLIRLRLDTIEGAEADRRHGEPDRRHA